MRSTDLPRRERRDVFVSYAREDVEFVHRLHDRLLDAGKTCYVDFRDIPHWSEDWQRDLYAQIDAANTVVLVLTPDLVASENVGREVDRAVEGNKRIRPLLLRDVDGSRVRPEVSRPQWLDFRDRTAFDTSFAGLLAVLETDVDWVEQHTRFLLAATDWAGHDEDPTLLLGRTERRQADAWLAHQGRSEPPPSALQLRFILASRAAAARRQRLTFGSVVAALVVTAGLAVFALIQRSEAIQQRDEARSRELAALATAQLETDPEESVRLALRAAGTAPTDQAEAALQKAVAQSHVRLALQPPGGAPSPILDSAVTPDGRYAVTVHVDRLGRVWDLRTGQIVATLRGHAGQVSSVDISADGRLAVTASLVSESGDDSARVWELPSGRLLQRLRHDADGIRSAVFSPRGDRVVTTPDGDAFDPAIIWDAKRGKRLVTLGEDGAEDDPAWAPDGKRVATIGNGITVWDASTGIALRRFPVGGDFAEELAFSPDGRRLAAAGDGIAFIATLATGKITRLPGRHDLFEALNGVRFCPDGTCVLTSSDDDTARIWSLSGRERAVLRGHTADVTAASLSRDGRYVATESEDGTARVWSGRSGAELVALRGHDGAVTGAHFLGRGSRVFTTGDDGTGRIWDPGVTVLDPHDGFVLDARFSPDGRSVATAAFDFTRLWSAGGKLLARMQGEEYSSHTGVIFSPDGTRLLTDQEQDSLFTSAGKRLRTFDRETDYATFSSDSALVAADAEGGVALFDARTGRDIATLKGSAFNHPASSPNGELVAAAGKTGAHVWNVRSRARTHDLRGPEGIDAVAFARDGRHLATSGDSAKAPLRIWDLETRQSVVLDTYPGGVRDFAYSPDGRLIASVSPGEQTVRVHDAETRERIAVLDHATQTQKTSFSPDSRLVLTVSDEKTAHLWDGRSGRLVTTLAGHTDTVTAARFSPDGRWIVTSSHDETAVIRRCDECLAPEQLLDVARRRVTTLTAGQ